MKTKIDTEAVALFWTLAAELMSENTIVVEGTIMNGRCLRVGNPDGHMGLPLQRIDRSLLARYLRLLCPPTLVDEVVLGGVQ